MPGPGKPFEKGKSGNPGGRKKQSKTVTKLAQEHCEDAIRILAEIANDPKAAVNSRVKACEVLLDRGYGKPRQAIDLAPHGGDNFSLRVEFIRADGE